MSQLKYVVDLFRSSNTPSFDGVRINASAQYSSDIYNLIKVILDDDFHEGTFNDIEIDGQDIYDADDLPLSGNLITYSFNVARRNADRFYISKSDFVAINSLKKGIIPLDFYIVADDYYSHDTLKPDYITKVEKICALIRHLSKIAHFHDIKSDKNANFYRLVFVLHSESKSSTAVIETNITGDIFERSEDDLNIDLIEALANSDASKDNHHIEKLNTFRNTLIEYIANTNNSFSHIIRNWNEINRLYSNNLAVYMSAFSFHKSRKEVTDAEIDYAEKISKILSEITNKSLAIPISLVAAISIFQLSETIVAYVAFSGVLLTSLITIFVSKSLKKQLNHVSHARDTLFNSLKERLTTDQSDLKVRLEQAIKSLEDNEIFCMRILDLMSCLAMMPTCVGIIALILKKFTL
ncbi:hypothetical protein G9X43_09085 [Cronobacter turicensis]|uniref:hypothetical protein n=1 Tax=Cronobacter turicensis TaxID=413502 RepID=UPI00141342BF|nr:hypothetical protein [Cronobacter turicensis]NHV08059.1 hypothetical protein [Cronobacter turicensis]NHV63055.1 hypothetical protein [Cronobacter turicensis]NHW09996.1 hypothetical protein [Cronobacter turicensis]